MQLPRSKFFSYFLISLLTFIFPFISYAQTNHPFNNIVFLGDSLSDNGNLYAAMNGVMPKSPPYFEGRFSNGYVWSEYVANYYYAKKAVSMQNYAVGGATTILHNPLAGYLPWTLSEELEKYLSENKFTDKSKTLFVIWIGANDYFNGANNVNIATERVIDAIQSTVDKLIEKGGNNFFLLNLPNLSKTPYGLESDSERNKNLNDLTIAHNSKLATMIAKEAKQHPEINIHLFDLAALFDDVLVHPDFYNQKYGIDVTDTTTACWQGSYAITKKTDALTIETQLSHHFSFANLKNQMDTKAFAQQVSISPSLREAYIVGESAEDGAQPCDNPENHIFWDHVHPTAVVHNVLSQNIIEYLDANYSPA